MMIGMIHQCKREGLLVLIMWHEIMDLILESKSLQRSPAVGDFYRTGIELWAKLYIPSTLNISVTSVVEFCGRESTGA